MSSLFVEGLPVVQIRGNNAHITFVAPERITISIELADFLSLVVFCEEAIAKWRYNQLEKTGSEPIPIGRGKKR